MASNLNTTISKIKQPSPLIVKNEGQENAKNSSNLKVAHTPIISTLPMLDSYVKKREENPKIQYKFKFKKPKIINLENILSFSVIGLSGISLAAVIKTALKSLKK